MKVLIFVFLLLPVASLAQFNLVVELRESGTGYSISDADLKVGYKRTVSGRNTSTLRNLTFDEFDDTLFISHDLYKFQNLPVTSRDYKIVGQSIRIIAYGQPCINRQITIKAPIAKSKKTHPETIYLKAISEDTLSSLELLNENDELICSLASRSNVLSFLGNVDYADLQNGYFKAIGKTGERTFPFDKNDFLQPVIFLRNDFVSKAEPRELEALKAHFLYVQSEEKSASLLRQYHVEQVNELEHTIDSLEERIDRLMNIPEPEFPYIIEEEPYPEAEIIDFPDIEAKPPMGIAQFITSVERSIAYSDLESKYSGTIMLKLKIDKAGSASFLILFDSMDDKDLVSRISYELTRMKWTVGEKRGRKVDTVMLVNIEITE